MVLSRASEFALFQWSGGSAEITIIQIWFKLGQSVRLHVISFQCELQKELRKIKSVKSFLLTQDFDSTFEELRP